jgi:putative copper resistance protein D
MKQNFIYTFILTTGVLLSGMVTITACAQDQWEPPMPKMLSSGGMVSIERGQNLFSEHCVNCHGIRGDGTGIRRYSWIPEQFVPDLTDADYLEGRDDDILVNLHDGLRNQDPPAVILPSFSYILSEEDMQSVLAYVKTLTKRTALESGK